MNTENTTYVFGRIGRSNTVHMFRKTEGYNPSCICGSNGWHHSKKSDANLTEKDVTCKKCLVRLEAIQRQDETIQNIMDSDNQPESPKSTRVLIERGSIFQAPKFGTGDKVLYYGKLFWVLSADLVNGIYAYQLQDTDGEIIGALIAESEIESPVQDTLVAVPDFLADYRAELEALRTQVATLTGKLNVMEVDRDSWKDSCIMANQRIDIESRQYQELHQAKEMITKLEADLASAKEIIVQAGAMVEKKSRSLLDALEANVTLRKENEELKKVMDEIYVLSLDEIFEDSEVSVKYLNNQLDKINRIASTYRPETASAEAQEKPILERLHDLVVKRGEEVYPKQS